MIKTLSDAFGVSGAEGKIRTLISKELSAFDVNICIDKMGNLFANYISNKRFPTIALVAHMDEPGFIITDITDDGYLKFDVIGDIKPSDIISKRVKIGESIGIIALKAIHLTTKKEREKPVKIEDLFIDIGASSKKQAREIVEIGDYCSFASNYLEFGDSCLKGKALGSRVGCSLLIDTLKQNINSNLNLMCVFTTQKEVMSRGAITAVREQKNVDYIIVIDSVSATTKKDKVTLGSGAVFMITADDTDKSKKFINCIKSLAKDKIKTQDLIIEKKGDIRAFKSNLAEIPSVELCIPCINMNTPSEIMSKFDIDSVYNIIISVLAEVEKNEISL